MLGKIKSHSKKLEYRRELRTRFSLKRSNAKELPRLTVYRSNNHISAQVIDDTKGITIAHASTLCKKDNEVSAKKNKCTMDFAKSVGVNIAKKALASGIKEVVFDKGGYSYHGKIKALAEAARENGLKF